MKTNPLFSIPLGCTLAFFITALCVFNAEAQSPPDSMILNNRDYLEYQGINVMLAQDFYPEGHQGGVSIIQNGQRVATNGDLRLNPTPGQWQPVPKVGETNIDRDAQQISVHMQYPDPAKNRTGFNPVIYPDLDFGYNLLVKPAGKSFRIIVDLDEPLPDEWIGKVGFNIELFPGVLFGKSYYMDDAFGIFPRQANSQLVTENGELEAKPMAKGNTLVVAPESDRQRMTIENAKGDGLTLLDGRSKHNNGWFVVRSLVPKNATKGAIEWLVTPHAIDGWKADPVIQVSQVGYHPGQQKKAIIQLDTNDERRLKASLFRILKDGEYEKVREETPGEWGDFLRYQYIRFDFSDVTRPGMYVVRYGDGESNPFQISEKVFSENVWQPTLMYFLPVQMCHMRINDRYRVWHDFCHMDDARMALTDSVHFDGYKQGPSTLTKFDSGDIVSGLNKGGWHDAGDYDLRVESQTETVHGLALAYEEFDVQYDNTTINQNTHVVDIARPDDKPDILQQIEHGLLSVIGGYENLGRFYRGIISPTLEQYRLLGDASSMSDNAFFDTSMADKDAPRVGLPGSPDDRWVFTEENPSRSLAAAGALAAAARVLPGYNDSLAAQSLSIAQKEWDNTEPENPIQKVELAVELLLTTEDQQYANFLVDHTQDITESIDNVGWLVGRTLPLVKDQQFKESITSAIEKLYDQIQKQGDATPYGVPYEPNIWGAGWGIQHFGYKQYFLQKQFPNIVSSKYMLDALNFILGAHPGTNTVSFVSGVGSESMIPGYGVNRADWSYIPGGSGSGTALIRPDYPELLKWPYLWQQTEYVLGGGTTDYLFLVLAANHVLNQ